MFRLPMKMAVSSTSAIARRFSTASGSNLNAADEADKIFLYTCGLTGAGTIGSGLYFASGVPRSDKARFFAAGALLVPTAISALFCPPAMGLVGIGAGLLYSARQERKSKISAQQSAQPSPPSPRP